jgi:hypothetical protein
VASRSSLCYRSPGPRQQRRARTGRDALTRRSAPGAPTEPALSRLAPASQNSLRSLEASSAQTAATSMSTKRASAPGTRRDIAGAMSLCAPQPVRTRLCAQDVGALSPGAYQAGCRGGWCPVGAISGAAAVLGLGVGARSALRDLTRRRCLSGARFQRAQRVLRRDLRVKQRSAVRAQRGPSQYEPLPGTARRDAAPLRKGYSR